MQGSGDARKPSARLRYLQAGFPAETFSRVRVVAAQGSGGSGRYRSYGVGLRRAARI